MSPLNVSFNLLAVVFIRICSLDKVSQRFERINNEQTYFRGNFETGDVLKMKAHWSD